MKHTKEEIINALKVIKDECEGNDCKSCPFGREKTIYRYECALNKELPEEWDLADEEPETWRAFK